MTSNDFEEMMKNAIIESYIKESDQVIYEPKGGPNKGSTMAICPDDYNQAFELMCRIYKLQYTKINLVND